MADTPIQRLQVYVDSALYEALRRESYRSKRSLSSLVREAVAERYGAKPRRRGASRLLDASGTLHDKAADVSSRHDDYLWDKP